MTQFSRENSEANVFNELLQRQILLQQVMTKADVKGLTAPKTKIFIVSLKLLRKQDTACQNAKLEWLLLS